MGRAVVTIDEILQLPKPYKLNKFVSLPSAIHGYSLAIEFMRNWILESFPKDFFKTVHVNGKHVLADYSRFNKQIQQQVIKPALAIVPALNTDFNRENVDLIQTGLNIYQRRTSIDYSFLKDPDNNLFLATQFKVIEMPFAFKMRVRTKAQQMDLLEYTRLNCRIGSTQTHFIDMDCHIPNDIIISIAIDAGFEVVENLDGQYRVKNTVAFLHYLNSHSSVPIVYKMRAINGKCEFFMRASNCYAHIACLDGITADDGERQGSADANFHVEFNAVLEFSVPAIYAYYSLAEHRIMNKEVGDIIGIYQIVSVKPPEKNEKGWNQYLTTQWIDDTMHIEDIKFSELIEGDLLRVIHHSIDIGISPAIFLDIKLYNGQREISIKIDWENYRIIVDKDMKMEASDITIYADLDYINTTLMNMDKLEEVNNRLSLGSKEVH